MNILKVLSGKSSEKQGCCAIQIVEMKESEKMGTISAKERECCPSGSDRECC
ncbi:MAG: hypothetical protein C0P66_003710 [Bacillaceae bacterium]